MSFFLGIDGGGTKTRCALGDETRMLATAVAAGCNVVRAGEDRAREALHAVIRQVCATANIAPDQIRGISIGAAGAARPDVSRKIRNIVAEITPASIEVVGDMVIALEAAFGTGPGVIAIAGTGSIVHGRDAAGCTARAGGWGFAISDEGSGQWIGRRAVTAILQAHDEGQPITLTSRVLEAWNLSSLDELVQKANSTPPPDFPHLVPIVISAAESADPAACTLLAEAGSRLARLAAIVLRRLAANAPYLPVALTGSVFRQSSDVREVFYNSLQENFPGVQIRREPVDPVEGALARARRTDADKRAK